MRRTLFAAPVALCACASSMVRAPKQIPLDGSVECTDTMGTPIAAAVGAVASAGVLAFAATHDEFTVDNGAILWAPLAGVLMFSLMESAGFGLTYVHECRDAKRRGAVQAEIAQRSAAQAKDRAEAGVLWKRAAAAARGDDCVTVRELDPQVRDLDLEFHAVVFSRDVAIAHCLAAGE